MTPQPPPPPITPESTTEGTLAAITPQETEPPYSDSIQVHLLDQIKVLARTVEIKQDEIDKLRHWKAMADSAEPIIKSLKDEINKLRTRVEQAEREMAKLHQTHKRKVIEATIEAERERDEALEALKPFADGANNVDASYNDNTEVGTRLGWMRRAAEIRAKHEKQ